MKHNENDAEPLAALRRAASWGDDSRLHSTFLLVSAIFFPRWNRSGRWAVREGTRAEYTRESGYCDADRHEILVSPAVVAEGGAELLATLIHEICHAAAALHHGRRFQARMMQAAARARDLLLIDVAEAIEWEVRQYADDLAAVVTAGDVHREVRDIGYMSSGTTSYEDAVLHVAGGCALTVEELERRFPGVRAAYDEGVELIKELDDMLDGVLEAALVPGTVDPNA